MIGMTGFDPTEPRVQLEVVREKLNNSEIEIRRLEGSLAQAYTNLGRKESELNQLRDSLGWVMIATAVILYLVGAVVIETRRGDE
jgi:hypothetical protein